MAISPPHALEKPRVAALVGATASGQPRWPWPWRSASGAGIVNADSLQVCRAAGYRHRQAHTDRAGPGAPPPHRALAGPRSHTVRPAAPGTGRQVLAEPSTLAGVRPWWWAAAGLSLKALPVGLVLPRRNRSPGAGAGSRCAGIWGTAGLPALYARPDPPGPGHRRPAPPRHLPDCPGLECWKAAAGRPLSSSSPPTAFRVRC